MANTQSADMDAKLAIKEELRKQWLAVIDNEEDTDEEGEED